MPLKIAPLQILNVIEQAEDLRYVSTYTAEDSVTL
jgi:hypothetical protein